MSRQLFGRWGSGLSAGEFAQAIAALGVLSDPHAPSVAPWSIGKLLGGDGLIHVWAAGIAQNVGAPPKSHPQDFAKAWHELRHQAAKNSKEGFLRLVLTPGGARLRPSLAWLLEQLGHPDVGASSVSVLRDAPGLEVAWNWPIRLGVLAGRQARVLQPVFEKRDWAHLSEIVPLGPAGGECDLLLVDGDLRGALAELLAIGARPAADCTVVLGEAGADDERAAALLAALREEVRSSGIVVAGIARERRGAWLTALIRELAHDMPLDVALWRAGIEGGGRQPYFEASPNLLRFARLRATASRMSDHLRAVARPISPVDVLRGGGGPRPTRFDLTLAGEEMRKISIDGVFDGEMHDASRIADIGKRAASTMGAPVRLAKKNGAPAPAPAAMSAPDPVDTRCVNFDLYDTIDPKPRLLKAEPLHPDRRYQLDISIGFPRKDGTSADGAFPKLPPSAEGHELAVVFCPLSRDARGELPEPQTGRLFLPPEGETPKPCSFSLDTTASGPDVYARVIIAYRNRVVQTLMFSAGVAQVAKQPAAAALRVESVVATDLDSLAYRAPVEAALVVNHSPAGSPGATALLDGEVRYTELPNVDKSVAKIRDALAKLAARKEPYPKLEDSELGNLLYTLATYGKLVWNELGEDVRKLLGNAGALQVVDARPGAYLPVEFFSDAPLAGQAPEVCPHAARYLGGPLLDHKECEHFGDEDYQCPLRFWGFQRVIERQAVYATDKDAGAFRLRSPGPTRPRIDAMRSVLFAASDKVKQEDQRVVEDALQTGKAKKLLHVSDWKAWRKAVQKNSPTLLVLLPHSDHPPGFDDIEALEIGKDLLPLQSFDVSDIAGPGSAEPVVFLLGCSTNLTELPFANFVSYARKFKASLVLGTLSPVSGRRAAAFVAEMTRALSKGGVQFGPAFLDVRRRLLATGNGFALTLVAYGDIDWIV